MYMSHGLVSLFLFLGVAHSAEPLLCAMKGMSPSQAQQFGQKYIKVARSVLEKPEPTKCWNNAAYLVGEIGSVGEVELLRDFILKGTRARLDAGGAVGRAIMAYGKILGRHPNSAEAKVGVQFLRQCVEREFWTERTNWRTPSDRPYSFATRSCINAIGLVPSPEARTVLEALLKRPTNSKWDTMRIHRALETQVLATDR
jgi:hypothetical protein